MNKLVETKISVGSLVVAQRDLSEGQIKQDYVGVCVGDLHGPTVYFFNSGTHALNVRTEDIRPLSSSEIISVFEQKDSADIWLTKG